MIESAIVVCPDEASGEASLLPLRVGGLPLLPRALLALQQAGAARLYVIASAAQRRALEPALKARRLLADRVCWQEPGQEAGLPSLALLLSPLVVLEPGALRAWVAGAEPAKSVIAPEESEAGPLIARAPALPAALRAARRGLAALAAFLREAWDGGQVSFRRWTGAPPVTLASPSQVPAVERALLRALRAPEDGPLLDTYVNRTVSGRLTRVLLPYPVTPNQVTLLSLAMGLLAAWLLAQPGRSAGLAGLALFQASVILDHADGEIARLKFQFSRYGKWLDNFSDHLVDLAVVGGIAWRAAGAGASGRLILVALLAAVGLTGAFLAVFFWSLRGGRSGASTPDPLAAMANRDGFSLALWGSVLLGRPELLLWVLAVGANLYWLAWLLTRPLYAPPRSGPPA